MTDMKLQLIQFLLSLPCVLIAITFHEYAHGYAAYRAGDPTAKSLGRLTLNPLKHIDPIGALAMIFLHFGWARPVPINTRHFKKPRRDMAIVALAGPLTNVILAFIGMLIYRVIAAILYAAATNGADTAGFAFTIGAAAITFFSLFTQLNVSFAVFNLLPIPPLDGSRILMLLLPPRAHMWVIRNERYISLALIVLLWVGVLSKPLSILVNLLMNGMSFLVSLIPFL